MVELSLHILDLIQNSVEAGARTVEVVVEDRPGDPEIKITIKDDGRGMSEDLCARAADPFVTTRKTRKVGLGLPLLKQVAQSCGGDISIESEPGKGTIVRAWFLRDNIDLPPLGDVGSSVAVAVATNPEIRFIYRHEGARQFMFDSAEIKQILGDVPVWEPTVVQWMKEYLRESIREARGGEPV